MFAERLQKLKPYKPGEQPKDRPYIKLNANENPYPPSPRVKEALASLDLALLARYPDPDSVELKKALAKMLNDTNGVFCAAPDQAQLGFELTHEMIFCSNGSDELLSFVFYAFFNADKPVSTPSLSYSFYPVYAGFYGIPLAMVPLKQDFSLDVDGMLAVDSSGIIFANPNAPTGIALSIDEVRAMLQKYPKNKVFVVDEAYTDFSCHTVLPLIKEFDNLLVVRTFSKSMSFAGMRLGYAVANPRLINALTTVKNSFNHFPVDVSCARAGIAACSDRAWYAKNTSAVINTRNNFVQKLISAGYSVIPSVTNFVLVSKNGKTGKDLYEAIKQAGILVRYFDSDGMRDFVRISIGTDEEMDALFAVMKNI